MMNGLFLLLSIYKYFGGGGESGGKKEDNDVC